MEKVKQQNRDKGGFYEEQALRYLVDAGCTLLEKNFHCKLGEIDLIVKDGIYICFVEVKYRRDTQMGFPVEAVDYKKQKQICKTSNYYCMLHGLSEFTPIRYDVVSICGHEIQWIRNAFEYIR